MRAALQAISQTITHDHRLSPWMNVANRHPDQPFIGTHLNAALPDFSDLRFSDFADAASVRSCGTCSIAMQRMSPIQSFTCVDLKETETVLSPQLGQMGKERDTVVVDCLVWNVCFRAKLSVDPALSGL